MLATKADVVDYDEYGTSKHCCSLLEGLKLTDYPLYSLRVCLNNDCPSRLWDRMLMHQSTYCVCFIRNGRAPEAC